MVWQLALDSEAHIKSLAGLNHDFHVDSTANYGRSTERVTAAHTGKDSALQASRAGAEVDLGTGIQDFRAGDLVAWKESLAALKAALPGSIYTPWSDYMLDRADAEKAWWVTARANHATKIAEENTAYDVYQTTINNRATLETQELVTARNTAIQTIQTQRKELLEKQAFEREAYLRKLSVARKIYADKVIDAEYDFAAEQARINFYVQVGMKDGEYYSAEDGAVDLETITAVYHVAVQSAAKDYSVAFAQAELDYKSNMQTKEIAVAQAINQAGHKFNEDLVTAKKATAEVVAEADRVLAVDVNQARKKFSDAQSGSFNEALRQLGESEAPTDFRRIAFETDTAYHLEDIGDAEAFKIFVGKRSDASKEYDLAYATINFDREVADSLAERDKLNAEVAAQINHGVAEAQKNLAAAQQGTFRADLPEVATPTQVGLPEVNQVVIEANSGYATNDIPYLYDPVDDMFLDISPPGEAPIAIGFYTVGSEYLQKHLREDLIRGLRPSGSINLDNHIYLREGHVEYWKPPLDIDGEYLVKWAEIYHELYDPNEQDYFVDVVEYVTFEVMKNANAELAANDEESSTENDDPGRDSGIGKGSVIPSLPEGQIIKFDIGGVELTEEESTRFHQLRGKWIKEIAAKYPVSPHDNTYYDLREWIEWAERVLANVGTKVAKLDLLREDPSATRSEVFEALTDAAWQFDYYIMAFTRTAKVYRQFVEEQWLIDGWDAALIDRFQKLPYQPPGVTFKISTVFAEQVREEFAKAGDSLRDLDEWYGRIEDGIENGPAYIAQYLLGVFDGLKEEVVGMYEAAEMVVGFLKDLIWDDPNGAYESFNKMVSGLTDMIKKEGIGNVFLKTMFGNTIEMINMLGNKEIDPYELGKVSGKALIELADVAVMVVTGGASAAASAGKISAKLGRQAIKIMTDPDVLIKSAKKISKKVDAPSVKARTKGRSSVDADSKAPKRRQDTGCFVAGTPVVLYNSMLSPSAQLATDSSHDISSTQSSSTWFTLSGSLLAFAIYRMLQEQEKVKLRPDDRKRYEQLKSKFYRMVDEHLNFQS